MVLAVEDYMESTTSEASSSSVVESKEKEANGTTNALLDELKAEFESLSTSTNFNRAGSDVRPVSAFKDRIVCEMTVAPGHVNAKSRKVGVGEFNDRRFERESDPALKRKNFDYIEMKSQKSLDFALESSEMSKLRKKYEFSPKLLQGTLHGGQTAALTDIVTARAIGQTVKDRPMASIELSVSYMHPVKLGDVIEITATVLKIGRNVAFSEAEFRRKSDGKLAAKGRHTVAVLPKPPNAIGTKVAQY